MTTKRDVFMQMKQKIATYIVDNLGSDHVITGLVHEILNRYNDIQMIMSLKEASSGGSGIPTFIDKLETWMGENGADLNEVDDDVKEGLRNRMTRLCMIAMRI